MGTPLKISSSLDYGTAFEWRIIYALVFLGTGVGVAYFCYLKSMLASYEAQGWTQAPCSIIASEVRGPTNRDGSGETVDIFYTYEVNGQNYHSERYDFTSGTAMVGDWREQAVQQYRPGTQAVCYFNPQNPAEAVLNKETHADSSSLYGADILGLIGLIFLIRVSRSVIRRNKFGFSELELRDAPVRLGDTLDGMITFGRRFEPANGFQLRLVCLKTTLRRYGAENILLWSEQKKVQPQDSRTISVSFILPEDGRESQNCNGVQILWQLEVSAAVSGVNFDAQFEVPVVSHVGIS